MAVEITIRLSESQAERLRALAQARGVSLETYLAEVAVQAAAQPAPTLSAWQEFLATLEPLSPEQQAILEREAARRPLFEERSP